MISKDDLDKAHAVIEAKTRASLPDLEGGGHYCHHSRAHRSSHQSTAIGSRRDRRRDRGVPTGSPTPLFQSPGVARRRAVNLHGLLLRDYLGAAGRLYAAGEGS